MNIKKADIVKILQSAKDYPSGDNMQPFEFEIKDDSIIIYYLYSRGAHEIVINLTPILIAYSALLEYLDIAAHNHSYQCKFENKISNNFDPLKNQLVGIVTLFKAEKVDEEITEKMLRERSTNRTNFTTIDNSQLIKLINKQQLKENVTLINPQDKEAIDFFSSIDSLLWSWKKGLLDFLKYVHFIPSSNERVGLPISNLQLGVIDSISLFIVKKFNFMTNLFLIGGAPTILNVKMSQLFKNSSYLVIHTTQNDIEAQIAILRRLTRLWINMCHDNIGVQPLTLSSYILNSNQEDIRYLRQKIGKKLEKRLQKAQSLKSNYNLGSYTLWVLRVGRTQRELKETERTNRLDLEDLIRK